MVGGIKKDTIIRNDYISHLFTEISKLIKDCMTVFKHDCTMLQLTEQTHLKGIAIKQKYINDLTTKK